MLMRVRNLGLPRGSFLLTVVLGIVTGIYIWKPVFDPAEKHKLEKYEKPGTSGVLSVCQSSDERAIIQLYAHLL